MIKEIKLYKRHQTGKIGWWCGKVVEEDGQAKLVMQSAGSEDAKAITHVDIIKGKNIGKANETSGLEQASKDLVSKANKKRDNGYKDSLDNVGEVATNTLGFVKPQKAMKLKDVNPNKIDWDNAYVQRKLDGHRASQIADTMYSSGGKAITLPHLENLTSPLQLDGELYIHGKTLTEIGKLVKKYRKGETEGLEYHVFDHVSDKPFSERLADLTNLQDELDHPSLVFVETYKVNSMKEVMEYHETFLAEGYEGTMLRQGTNGYKGGSRAIDIIKIKDMDDAEWDIVDVIEGKPKLYRGVLTPQAVFVMMMDSGETFTVLAHGTVPDKAKYLEDPKKYIGKSVTVQHFGFTDYGIPNLPVAKGFREDL